VDDFYLGQYEVTQAQWEKVMGNNPSLFKEGRDNPVEQVSWNDVQMFIDRLNNQSGRKYRLPTEAEWEYAARSGGKREKYSGTSQAADLRRYAWHGDRSGVHHRGGEKRPNELDLYDMTGNVWEWCADWYGENYYLNSPKDNPRGPGNGWDRVLRGGSWVISPGFLRVTYRDWSDPASRSGFYGFRLAAPAR
jgi:sulfatase modifying factor 1